MSPPHTIMEPHKEQGGKVAGLSLARHSLTSFSKRRPFSRKPSSWRHPGGTVSETEETDFSECDETAETTEESELTRRKPSHVHSFTFSSLSMFRSKHRHSSGGDGTSQLSFEGSTEETRAGDCLEIKQITSPARSPNRKFKEATDKVRDNLRAYAQRFKENRERGERGEREGGRSELTGGRSASAGREETIEEETTEDVEAERSGVTRAYSLNSRQISKPLLQSHSSTESTDVPTTPRTSPTRTKKKLSLKNRKSGDVDPNIQAPYKRNVKISKSETPKKDNSAPSDVKDRASQSSASQSLCLPPPPPPPASDFTLALPEVFRQAIQEVDSLTEKCVCEGEILSNEARTVPDCGQEVMTDNSSDETGQTGLTSERRCYPYMAQSQAEDTETGESEEEERIRVKSCQTLKKWSPSHSEQVAGQRSRQGSKRRRKKESGNSEGKMNSPQLSLKIISTENRRASDTSLPQHSLEQSLPSSPSPSSATTEPESRSPQIIFTGSSTLPRSTSEHRRQQEPSSPSNQTSILTLQLEGPYGCAMSICEGNSREDTISPMVSQKTGETELTQIKSEDKVCLFSRKEGIHWNDDLFFNQNNIKQRI